MAKLIEEKLYRLGQEFKNTNMPSVRYREEIKQIIQEYESEYQITKRNRLKAGDFVYNNDTQSVLKVEYAFCCGFSYKLEGINRPFHDSELTKFVPEND